MQLPDDEQRDLHEEEEDLAETGGALRDVVNDERVGPAQQHERKHDAVVLRVARCAAKVGESGDLRKGFVLMQHSRTQESSHSV